MYAREPSPRGPAVPLKLRQVAGALPTLMLKNPYDLQATLQIVDGIAWFRPLELAYERLARDLSPEQREHYRELTFRRIDLDHLRGLPHGSYGRALAAFVDAEEIDPEYFLNLYPPARQAMHDHWIMYRFAKVHDPIHVLMGLSTWMPHEMGLQLFHTTNFGEPLGLGTFVMFWPIVLKRAPLLPTVREMVRLPLLGPKLPNLLWFPHEERWEQDLLDLRAELGIPPEGYPA